MDANLRRQDWHAPHAWHSAGHSHSRHRPQCHERPYSALFAVGRRSAQVTETLVLPVGWFKPQRVIDVFSEKSRQLRLIAVLDRGTDFERVEFRADPTPKIILPLF